MSDHLPVESCLALQKALGVFQAREPHFPFRGGSKHSPCHRGPPLTFRLLVVLNPPPPPNFFLSPNAVSRCRTSCSGGWFFNPFVPRASFVRHARPYCFVQSQLLFSFSQQFSLVKRAPYQAPFFSNSVDCGDEHRFCGRRRIYHTNCFFVVFEIPRHRV